MALKLSSRHEWVRKSELRSMSVECERVGGVNLSQGVCDLTVPEPVTRAAMDAIKGGQNSYSRHDGTASLRNAIAAKYCRRAGLDVDPETSVPGQSFFKGQEGETIWRFCFAKEDDVIEDACRRLQAFMSEQERATG